MFRIDGLVIETVLDVREDPAEELAGNNLPRKVGYE